MAIGLGAGGSESKVTRVSPATKNGGPKTPAAAKTMSIVDFNGEKAMVAVNATT
jgi:hypothetical protein